MHPPCRPVWAHGARRILYSQGRESGFGRQGRHDAADVVLLEDQHSGSDAAAADARRFHQTGRQHTGQHGAALGHIGTERHGHFYFSIRGK